VTSARARPGPR